MEHLLPLNEIRRDIDAVTAVPKGSSAVGGTSAAVVQLGPGSFAFGFQVQVQVEHCWEALLSLQARSRRCRPCDDVLGPEIKHAVVMYFVGDGITRHDPGSRRPTGQLVSCVNENYQITSHAGCASDVQLP